MKNYLVILLMTIISSSCGIMQIKKKEEAYIKKSKDYLASWSIFKAEKCQGARDSALSIYALQLPAYDTIAGMKVLLKESVDRINNDFDECLLKLELNKKAMRDSLFLDEKSLKKLAD